MSIMTVPGTRGGGYQDWGAAAIAPWVKRSEDQRLQQDKLYAALISGGLARPSNMQPFQFGGMDMKPTTVEEQLALAGKTYQDKLTLSEIFKNMQTGTKEGAEAANLKSFGGGNGLGNIVAPAGFDTGYVIQRNSAKGPSNEIFYTPQRGKKGKAQPTPMAPTGKMDPNKAASAVAALPPQVKKRISDEISRQRPGVPVTDEEILIVFTNNPDAF